MAETIITDAEAAATEAKAVEAEKLRLEQVAQQTAEADAKAAITAKAEAELKAERDKEAEQKITDAARDAKLAPHTARLDTLVRDGKITPAERKDAEKAILGDQATGFLLDTLAQRSPKGGEQTNAQVGTGGGGLVASAERIAEAHKKGRF